MLKNIQETVQKQKKILLKKTEQQKLKFKKFIKPKPEESIGVFNLFLIGSIFVIIVLSISKINSRAIIKASLKNNPPPFQITTDFFVDKNSTAKNRDGSPTKPFKTISQALTFLKKNPNIKNIYLKPAQYKGNLEIPQNLNIYAYQPETSIVALTSDKKNLTLLGNNIIQGLTLKNARYGIYIPAEAQSIQIKNCQIKESNWYGVYNEKHPETNEQYKLEITNSQISGNFLQGLYLQKGTFVMKNSKSINNGEEGIDLHIDMNSTILNSEISNNGEGGIETELGNINLTIENCLIENNKSSGINLQSYSENSFIKIQNNQINNNTDFGIRCALHASFTSPYFAQAFETHPTEINTFSDNGVLEIDSNCQK